MFERTFYLNESNIFWFVAVDWMIFLNLLVRLSLWKIKNNESVAVEVKSQVLALHYFSMFQQ